MEVIILILAVLILIALIILILLANKMNKNLEELHDPIIKSYFAQKIILKQKFGINVDKFYDMYIEKMIAAFEEPMFDNDEEE